MKPADMSKLSGAPGGQPALSHAPHHNNHNASKLMGGASAADQSGLMMMNRGGGNNTTMHSNTHLGEGNTRNFSELPRDKTLLLEESKLGGGEFLGGAGNVSSSDFLAGLGIAAQSKT